MENNKKQEVLNAFKSIIDQMEVEYLYDNLLQAYFDYSQLLTKSEDMFLSGSSEKLYCLSILINVLDGKK
ncbi:MAG: hypothetical protein KKE39_05460 [Bacteroidetes bacterium]|nr:hypothetical protein [Bacteroidota bacterium]MBU1373847.1 hypothetical protein [Bacteroidota bacterium]MBU1483953.1 hypothetical protein [Bacteroidota bacterium]MBU1761153.1 hypothetical protein [Bacteroidota bacterium]MBU2268191.1 hypothetical protein [Bacteroidota bacterium]